MPVATSKFGAHSEYTFRLNFMSACSKFYPLTVLYSKKMFATCFKKPVL
jgi:hypothetical protein